MVDDSPFWVLSSIYFLILQWDLMHEMSIALSIVQAVDTQGRQEVARAVLVSELGF